MASLVDRVVLVTSVGYTKIDELNDAKKALEKLMLILPVSSLTVQLKPNVENILTTTNRRT